MTYRLRWALGLCFTAFVCGCSSSSPGAPPDGPPGTPEDAGGEGDATTGTPPPMQDAAPAAMCDAVSLAPVADAGAAACFECQAAHCMPQVAACSTDCACAPAYVCLQRNSTGDSLNSGYSACPDAIDVLMNGNQALMDVAGCATTSCNAQCFGGAAGGADGG
jgi:hypothetical protein